jgi:arginine deiminase
MDATRGSLPQEKEAGHGGPGWVPRTASLEMELGNIWGDFGVHSEYGRLRSVLMRRPGEEIEGITNPSAVLWNDLLNPTLAREQHDALVELYVTNGIVVHHLIEGCLNKPNMYFCRDLFCMTPSGAILSRPASAARAGEERYVAKTLAELGIPILLTVFGDATFEGADVVIVNADLVFIGEGVRTNHSGAEQVKHVFRELGFGQVELIQLCYGCGHLDGVLNILDKDLAVLYPTQVAYRVYEVLTNHGFKIINLPDKDEAHVGMAINMVPLEPRVVVLPSGNPKTRDILEREGVTCLEVDVTELMKGGGAIHCMTGILKRDRT